MNIQRCIWGGVFLLSLITSSTTVYAKSKIRTCADLKTDIILKKARPYKVTIEKYARLHHVNADFVLAIAAVETCFNAKAVSPVGAKGLMQLMPVTAKRFGVESGLSVKQSIKGGTKYLKFLMGHYKDDMRHAAAAYNAGEGRVDKYKGVPPYRETRRYVKNVLRVYNKLTALRTSFKKQSHTKTQPSARKIIRKNRPHTNNLHKKDLKTHLKVYKTLKIKPKRRISEQQTFQLAVRLLLK